MNKVIDTERLILREFIYDDAPHFFKMNNDPNVIKYTGDKAFDSLEDARIFLSKYNQYELYGMGRWAVCLKSNQEFLGWCGLKFHPTEKKVEVGFRFYRKFWNKGYATESAKASIAYGFEKLYLKEIYAHAHTQNLASQNVIEKCGLKKIKEASYDAMPTIIYQIKNPHYKLKIISTEDTYLVRHPVLRVGRPLSDCAFDGDNKEGTFHIGLFFKDSLIGVATFLNNSNDLFPDSKQYQLRGMAILKDFQKKGLGGLLLSEGERLLNKQCSLIWCNAREIAVNFYNENGYHISGTPFEIEKIGLHYVMSKKII